MKRIAFCLLAAHLASLCSHAEERAPAPVAAEKLTVVRANPGNYREKAAALEPGTQLSLDPGRYERGLRLKGVHGREGAPIVIAGTSGKTVFVARKGANTIDLTDASWIVLRDLDFDGRGLPVDAIKAGGDTSRGVHHVTIEGCTIRGHGAHQNIVGISNKMPAWDWVIRGNTIIGAGTGIYLGNSNGHQPFVGGLIESNIIVNPVGYCMQIKHQFGRPELAGLEGMRQTTIRHNLFIKDDRKSDAGNRPNLLVGGFPDDGAGSEDRYLIHDNILFHNHREALFQGTGRIELRDNLFIDCKGTALRVMRHNGQEPMLVKIRGNGFHVVGKTISLSRLPAEAKSDVGDNRELNANETAKRIRAIGTEVSNREVAPYLEQLVESL